MINVACYLDGLDLRFTYREVKMFICRWNEIIDVYGFLSVALLAEDVFLLGSFDDVMENCKFTWNKYGWSFKVRETDIFEPLKGNERFMFKLNLPVGELEVL